MVVAGPALAAGFAELVELAAFVAVIAGVAVEAEVPAAELVAGLHTCSEMPFGIFSCCHSYSPFLLAYLKGNHHHHIKDLIQS
jgi:hypothetical protein